MKRNVAHYDYDCLNEALDILVSIGMPATLTNPRSVMTLAALAEIYPGKNGGMPQSLIMGRISL